MFFFLRIGPYGKLLEEARKERNDALVKLEENRDDFKNALSEFLKQKTNYLFVCFRHF